MSTQYTHVQINNRLCIQRQDKPSMLTIPVNNPEASRIYKTNRYTRIPLYIYAISRESTTSVYNHISIDKLERKCSFSLTLTIEGN